MSREFDNDDDVVDRALDALHHERVPYGPSSDVAERTLDAMKTHAASGVAKRDSNERSTLFTRMLTMTFAQRIAAVVTVTIGALVLWFMFALFGGFGTVSYAQVAQQIKDAQSMTFKMTITTPTLPKPIEAKLYALEPGKLRNEGPDGLVTISRKEGEAIRILSLMPRVKQARLLDIKFSDASKSASPDFVVEFRKLADKQGEPLAERQVGDVKAKGFRVTTDGQVVSLWAHPKTALPLLVEMDVPMAGEGSKVVMSEIAFDMPLAESLFSLEPPAGYELQESKLSMNTDLETNLINLFQLYTGANDGKFPEKFNDWPAYTKLSATQSKGGKLDPQTLQKMAGVGAVPALLTGKKPGEDYAYTGRDAKLNDKDKIIFWHRDPKEGTYRAIYADLTAKDVTAEQILKTR